METTQDKLIREKLNSLHSLPEGYAPSLDSKWELLLAGQPKKPERKPFFWLAAAASVLFVLGFSYWFLLLQPTQISESVALKTQAANPEKRMANPAEIQLPANAKMPEKAVVSTSIEPKNAKVLPVKTSANTFRKNKITSAEDPAKTEIKTPETVALAAEKVPMFVAAETPKASRKKKSRFVEMDFDSPETTIIQPQNPETAQLSFKIKFLPRETSTAPAAMQTDKLLRLQHTF